MKIQLPSINNEAMKSISIAVDEKHPISVLEQLGVSQRMINLLQANGINDMHDLMYKSREDLLKMQNFGTRQLQILFEAISKFNLIED